MIANVKACAQTGKRRIFNHDILSCTHRDVPGNYLYSGRALGLTCPDDVIQIHPFLKQEWPSIRAHYARIGLAHTDHVIWDVDRARMNDHPELEASMFFFGPNENRHRRDRDWQRVVEYINDKNNFVPWPATCESTYRRPAVFMASNGWLGSIISPIPVT